MSSEPVPRLDAHQHFWRYDAAQYPWIPLDTPLQRDWLPGDLAALQTPLELDGSIAVQARQTLEESRWLLELADQSSVIKGVVGWVDLRSENVEAQLASLAHHPKFVGVRHVVQDEPDDRFMLSLEFLRGIAALRQFDLTYDILIFPKQLPAAIELVSRFPEQPFVLDHLAKPFIKVQNISPWREQLRELASAPNVLCKVSGLITEADHAAWRPEHVRPYLEVAFDAFGAERLMFGSDWPVCLLAGTYERVFRLIDDYMTGSSDEAHAAFFGGNAARFYLGKGALP
jgi:L-fuconolactonase